MVVNTMARVKKVMAIGNLEGRYEVAERAMDAFINEGFDKIVFMGDYVHSPMRQNSDVIHTLATLSEFKKQYGDKVILLYGDQELDYINFPNRENHNVRTDLVMQVKNYFTKHQSEYDIAYKEGKYLFTHAGLTRRWFMSNEGSMFNILHNTTDYGDLRAHIEDVLNTMFYSHMSELTKMKIGEKDGLQVGFGSPCTATREELINEMPLIGYHQITSHSPVYSMTRCAVFTKNGEKYTIPNTSISFINEILSDEPRIFRKYIPLIENTIYESIS